MTMENSGTTIYTDNYFLEAMEERVDAMDTLLGTPTMYSGELEQPSKELDNMHFAW